MTDEEKERQRRFMQAAIDHAQGVRPLGRAITAFRGDGGTIDGSRIGHYLKGERRVGENTSILIEGATNGAARAADLSPYLAGLTLQQSTLAEKRAAKAKRRSMKTRRSAA